MIKGVLSLRGSNSGSQPYLMMDIGIHSAYAAVQLKKKKMLIEACIDTLVPTFFSVVFTVCIVLAHIVMTQSCASL